MANEAGSFDFWLRFGSVTGCSTKHAPSPKPNLGLVLKSPAPNGYNIFLNRSRAIKKKPPALIAGG
jgi:hypothetical protein